MNIDISEWKAFKIGDLFDKVDIGKKKSFNKVLDVSEEQTDEFDLPIVNAKHGNNGIMYYGRSSEFDSEIMTLGIVQNGAIATGDVYAHIDRTGVLGDAYLIKPKFPTSRLILLFMACVVQKAIKQRFSYDDKAVWDKVKEVSVMLPVTDNDEPDWAYIEEYMRNIEEIAIEELDNLKLNPLKKHIIDIGEWKEFEIGSLFDYENTGNIIVKSIEDDNDGINFVTAQGKNNGVLQKVEVKSEYKVMNGNCIFIGGKTFTVNYQEEDFVSNDSHNFILRAKEDKLTKYQYLFLASVLQRLGEERYKWNDAVTGVKLLKEVMYLPADDADRPDWEYMGQYMQDIEQNVNMELDKLSFIA